MKAAERALLTVFPRPEFAEQIFDYRPGEHVVFGGRTQKGKTKLAFDLLEYIVTPDFPAYVAQSKPDDKVTRLETRRLGFREVDDWPVPRKVSELWDGKPVGYLVKIKFGNIDTDMDRCAAVTARLIQDRYTAGVKGKKGVLVMDDTMVKARIMRLDGQMVTILAMAGAMGLGLWIFVQKPTDSGRTPLWGFENAEHIFLTKGGDDRMVRRYMEIAGENGVYLRQALNDLAEYQFVYLKKTEGYMCIVDAK